MSEVGFIGTGIMGRPMAQRLQQAGHQLFFSEHYKAVPTELLNAGGTVCPDPAAVAGEAEFIILMLPNTQQVEEVLFGRRGVAEGVLTEKVVIDMSSISPEATRNFARQINDLGGSYLDAPVSGGDIGAAAGSLTIMVGGLQSVFERARPLFEVMGQAMTLIGDNGAGQTCKLANQIVVANTLEAVAEALVFAAKAGADPVKVRQALLGGFASSRILEVHAERMLRRAFEPGFKVALHQKDLNLALEAAQSMGVSLPNTKTVQELFDACIKKWGGELDNSVLIQEMEEQAGIKVS